MLNVEGKMWNGMCRKWYNFTNSESRCPKYRGRHGQRGNVNYRQPLVAFAFLPISNRLRVRSFVFLCVVHSSSLTISHLLNR